MQDSTENMKQNAKDNVSGRARDTSTNCIMSFSEGVKGEHCRLGTRALQAAFPEEVGTVPGQAHGIECSRTPRQ